MSLQQPGGEGCSAGVCLIVSHTLLSCVTVGSPLHGYFFFKLIYLCVVKGMTKKKFTCFSLFSLFTISF